MKKIILIAFSLLIFCAVFNLGNPYLSASEFESVTVHRGESVWSIAERYTDNHTEAKKLSDAILEINGLSKNGAVNAGDTLRVPLLRRATFTGSC